MQARIALTIEAALQESPSDHATWIALVSSPDAIPIDVEITGLSGTDGDPGLRGGIGGGGGSAAWPGGGGGGGGSGTNDGGIGGSGADGAIVIFQIAADGRLLDVEAIVTPGNGTWCKREDTDRLKVIAIGAGGGGAGGGPVSLL